MTDVRKMRVPEVIKLNTTLRWELKANPSRALSVAKSLSTRDRTSHSMLGLANLRDPVLGDHFSVRARTLPLHSATMAP